MHCWEYVQPGDASSGTVLYSGHILLLRTCCDSNQALLTTRRVHLRRIILDLRTRSRYLCGICSILLGHAILHCTPFCFQTEKERVHAEVKMLLHFTPQTHNFMNRPNQRESCIAKTVFWTLKEKITLN